MTGPTLELVDLSPEVLERALAHAEQPARHCHICANGSPIRPEDYDLAISARLYNGRRLLAAMMKHLGRQRHPQVSLTAIHQIFCEIVKLRMAKEGKWLAATRVI